MRLTVGQRAQSLVIFLACSVPQGKLDRLAIYPAVRNVVLEHGRNISLYMAKKISQSHGADSHEKEEEGLTVGK